MASDILAKVVELLASNPNPIAFLLLAAGFLLLTAAPIVALSIVGYALRMLAPRKGKAGRK